jgi:hypothetical protein
MNIKWVGAALVSMSLVYCGGGSGGGGTGVDPNRTIASLTDDELMDLCEHFVGLEPSPARTIDCGDGNTIEDGIDPEDIPEAIQQCVSTAPEEPCPLTVGDAEDCFEALATLTDDELCEGVDPSTIPECAGVLDAACE